MEHTFELIKFLFILGLFAFGALFMTKKFKRRQLQRTSPKGMIQVQDAVQLGMTDKVYILKVGKQQVLVTTASNGVAMLKLDETVESETEGFEELFAKDTPATSLKDLAKSISKGMKRE